MKIVAVLSMLHEGESQNSATRELRGQKVAAWTIARLQRVTGISDTVLLCRKAQAAAASAMGTAVVVEDVAPMVEAIRIARTWCEGWRGGLLLSSEYDLGFDAAAMLSLVQSTAADALLLINPAACLVDTGLIQQVVDRAHSNPALDFVFVHGAPGCGGVLLRQALLARLREANAHPGVLLSYRPTSPTRDPIGGEACITAPTRLARTLQSLKADTPRRIVRLEEALGSGSPDDVDALAMVQRLEEADAPVLKDVTVELTLDRSTRPVWHAAGPLQLTRPDADASQLQKLWTELSGSDARVTLAGSGDPVLHPEFPRIVSDIAAAGLPLHVETDLVDIRPEALATLASGQVHVLSIHIPAGTPATYQKVMGANAMERIGANLQALLEQRSRRGAGALVPLIVPTLYKVRENLAEIEAWYDHWISTFGSAVIRSPSDLCGTVPALSPVDMTPAQRRPCRRINRRLTVLADGRIAPCEEDVQGSMSMGSLDQTGVATAFAQMESLRSAHRCGELAETSPCRRCKEWYRV